MLKQSLQQKLLQKLSPQQIQLIKLLEIPTISLEQRIKKELEENPALEEGNDEEIDKEEEVAEEKENDSDEFSIEDYLNEEDVPSYKLNANNYSKDDENKTIPFSVGTTFHEDLERQAGLRNFNEQELKLALYLIGSIDEDGYLRRELDAIVDDVAFILNISVNAADILKVLKVIQDFDPPGVGARDLQECLLLQLSRKNQENEIVALATNIIKNSFNEITKKHYDKILNRYNIDEDDLKDVLDEIIKLNPKPGNSYNTPNSKTFHHITPDFTLDYLDGNFQLSLNTRNAPDLKLSRKYTEMLQDFSNAKGKVSKKQKETVTFVKQKLDSARWFIDAIKQRQHTLMITMNTILNFQEEYFQEGDETKLRPMILKDIAELTNLDISTISRVANSKYIQTHFGIFPLKFFFSEGLQTDSGEEVSTREIKRILQDCIDNEDKRKPLTDDKLASILNEKGYHIARRTVAKYREQLNIPVGRLRKEL